MTIHRTVAALATALSLCTAMAIAPAADLVAAQKERIAGYAKQPMISPRLSFVSNGVADFWTIAKAGAIAAGKSKDIDCDVTVEFPGGGLGDQKRMLEDLVIKGIDGISVSPIDPTNQVEVLNLVGEHQDLALTADLGDTATDQDLTLLTLCTLIAEAAAAQNGQQGEVVVEHLKLSAHARGGHGRGLNREGLACGCDDFKREHGVCLVRL